VTSNPSTIGARCRAAREACGMSQEEAAFRLRAVLPKGRAPGGSVISRIETGKIAHPEPYVIVAMAWIYGVDIRDISPEIAEEAAMIGQLLTKCAPRDSNSEPADSFERVVDLRDLVAS